MPLKISDSKGKFGTTPVFLASISTILGAILFLRFGYAVGNVGLMGALGIILLGHLVTVPTALAIAEIATNRKVEGGGAYWSLLYYFSFVRTKYWSNNWNCTLSLTSHICFLLCDCICRVFLSFCFIFSRYLS